MSKYDEIVNELVSDKRKIFIELYLKQYGENFVLINYPENWNDCYKCLMYKHFTISEVQDRQFKNILVQFDDPNDINTLRELSKVFGFKIFEKVNLKRIEFTDNICDNLYKHNPVNTFGMLCQNTYEDYFKNDANNTNI